MFSRNITSHAEVRYMFCCWLGGPAVAQVATGISFMPPNPSRKPLTLHVCPVNITGCQFGSQTGGVSPRVHFIVGLVPNRVGCKCRRVTTRSLRRGPLAITWMSRVLRWYRPLVWCSIAVPTNELVMRAAVPVRWSVMCPTKRCHSVASVAIVTVVMRRRNR